jgi:hypothetical protein
MRRILLDADTFIELAINRSMFQEEVKDLREIINIKEVEFYLSDFGFKKIKDITNVMKGHNASKEISYRIRKLFKIKILKTTKFIIEEARLLPIKDFDSCIEIALALNSSITAIVTHEISKFSESELNIWSLTDFQERENLEKIFSKETSSRPMVLDIKGKIATLNHLYTLPSHASEESIELDKLGQKSVNPYDIAHLSSRQDLLISQRHKSIVALSRLAINKGLIENLANTTALRKPVIDNFTALHPLRDLPLSQRHNSIRLTMNKE